ncbi:four-carbon acid sugar kinase family protein [Shinella daejeonensis]|uniref:3-oxo-tetronate kinase n=1 Tax=Shinella daejeonensis TaxID=659017 RepID=UPI0020C7775F|nr:3-oxo-tetronate kinase [Shinella daejeonensis]MCP8895237.1 four-carbon acid sugar kinase family protein [Shinella daejeonensis]
MLLGAIADDLTGATDLALTLSREGMRTVQVVGVPPEGFTAGDAEAVVVALKSRTIAPQEAVSLSLAALERLRAAGARQIVFKYCSTFDSTEKGNIGPVTDALADTLGTQITIVCPSFPANGRTVYHGHLFVGDDLLSESPMKDHPLTPMRDSSLLRLMQAQSHRRVGLIRREIVAAGPQEVHAALEDARLAGNGIVVIDAICDEDLRTIGAAVADLPLVTGGSGIALGLPANFRRQGLLAPPATAKAFGALAGRAVVLSGSCSKMTREQIRTAVHAGMPALKIDPLQLAGGDLTPQAAVEWAIATKDAIPLLYSSADPAEVQKAQNALGRERAGALVEAFLAEVATALRAQGFSRFLVAGGETSGAVVEALRVPALFIGPEIDPGVPWTLGIGMDQPIALALKSGNFGGADFFLKAWDLLK